MPYLVDVEIKTSSLGGRGVFASQPIKEGQMIWRFALDKSMQPGKVIGTEVRDNRSWTRAELEELGQKDAKALLETLHGGYYHPPTDRFLELRDGSQFTNHSEQPLLRGPQSTADIDSDVCYARRDISVGEELTDHYGYYAADEVTPDWLKDLNTRYCPERAAFESTVPVAHYPQ